MKVSSAWSLLRERNFMTLTAAKRPVVLIVEDEFVLRMNAVEMIKEAGFGQPLRI
jgi:hypothetical protein